jgi:hypothetical protein
MYDKGNKTMYVESVYHNVDEEGATVGKRMSAKELFKFVRDMGYDTIGLDDASSIHFNAKKPIVDAKFEQGITGQYEHWTNLDTFYPDGYYVLQVQMTMFNLLKHIVNTPRISLRVYADAEREIQRLPGTPPPVARRLTYLPGSGLKPTAGSRAGGGTPGAGGGTPGPLGTLTQLKF